MVLKASRISMRTLEKWEKQLQEMNRKSSGQFFTNINYALHLLKQEIKFRKAREEN